MCDTLRQRLLSSGILAPGLTERAEGISPEERGSEPGEWISFKIPFREDLCWRVVVSQGTLCRLPCRPRVRFCPPFVPLYFGLFAHTRTRRLILQASERITSSFHWRLPMGLFLHAPFYWPRLDRTSSTASMLRVVVIVSHPLSVP